MLMFRGTVMLDLPTNSVVTWINLLFAKQKFNIQRAHTLLSYSYTTQWKEVLQKLWASRAARPKNRTKPSKICSFSMWLKGTTEGRVIRRNLLAEVHSLMHHLRSSWQNGGLYLVIMCCFINVLQCLTAFFVFCSLVSYSWPTQVFTLQPFKKIQRILVGQQPHFRPSNCDLMLTKNPHCFWVNFCATKKPWPQSNIWGGCLDVSSWSQWHFAATRACQGSCDEPL